MDLNIPDGYFISLVAAAAANNVIGDGEKMPWHIPEDLKHFKNVTSGKPVIMGRKTYDSIGRPLPKRTNIVITRDKDWHAEGVVVVHDLQTAIDEGVKAISSGNEGVNGGELCVIGGGHIYQQFLKFAQMIHLTRVAKNFKGSALFPELNEQDWVCVSREKLISENMYDFEIFFEQHNRR